VSGNIVTWSTRAATIALAILAFVSVARAQEPTANAVATARELIELKGASGMWEPVIPGLVQRAKGVLLQSNPNLSKDLDDVANQLRTEYAARRADVSTEVARVYARHFTEAELKDLLAFYKTPLGRKIVAEEPRALEESIGRMEDWARRISDELLPRFRAEMKKKGHNL
jgi:hypothetical protein